VVLVMTLSPELLVLLALMLVATTFLAEQALTS